MSNDAVHIEGLSVSYRGARVVDDVSFVIEAGTAYGLVGESGSGKSTIAGTLTASLAPSARVDARQLVVDGVDVLGLRSAGLRRFRQTSVAVVHQEPGLALNPTMTVERQVGEVLRLRGQGRSEAAESVVEAFRRVGLPSPTTIGVRYPHELSGGQQQRVAIAMALVARPPVLVLDEPTTGLDSTVEAGIMSLIDELRDEIGFATLLISHNLPLVAAHCDRIGVLEHGVLVEEGAAEDIIHRPAHPYTTRLIAALPDISVSKARVPGSAGTVGSASLGVAGPEVRLDPPVALGAPDAPVVPGAPDSPVPLVAPGSPVPLVTVRGLFKEFDGVAALDGIDLEVRRGEILGIVGESGSGKSTFGRVLAGLTSFAGSVQFDEGSTGAEPLERRPRAQVVFQNADASLNPRRTVRRILGRAIELLGGTGSAGELAARVGLGPEMLDRRPAELSGGQKQRVAIARAFAGPVPLVICDEPTSALDVSVQARILDLLLDLQADSGATLVFISHDLAVVRRVSDRVAVFSGGRVVDLAPADDVFTAATDPYSRQLIESAFDLRRRAGLLEVAR
jgi:peptide/nickel transport system ATP-binding protein